MQRMTGLDAGYLYMETPTLHMHTLKISVLDPSTVPGGYSFPRVKDELRRRLHLLPPFRRRMVDIPFGIHHPVWVEDPDFDLDWHVRRVAVPAPGGQREFCELISDIAGHQLDRRRPLWEIWVVEGLSDGRVGFVAKLHHSLADGVAAAALLANVLEATPDAPAPPAPAPWSPEPVPGRLQLISGAAVDAARALAGAPALLARTIRGLRAAGQVRRRHPDVPAAKPLNTPKTSFNGALTSGRLFATATLPLDDVKAVRTAFGVTVNDVVLAVCAGALSRYLDGHGERPAKPLLAGVPVSVSGEPEDGPRLSGNRVSNMFVSLRTDVDDPVDRLQAIHRSAIVAKEAHVALGASMLADWSELTPPRLFAAFMRWYSRRRLAEYLPPPQNAVISNVAGPAQPLYIAGARLVELYSVGPILEGIGLNITVWSYLGTLYAGLISCPELMPDLWELADLLGEALAELRKAAAA